MVWRHPPGLKLCETPPPEDEVKNALSAQYKSTYRTDFLGIPQGRNTNYTKRDEMSSLFKTSKLACSLPKHLCTIIHIFH